MVKNTKKEFLHKSFFPLKNRIAITTGDLDSIGCFVATKSLASLGPQKNFQFLVWTGKNNPPLKISKFKTKVFSTAKKALESPFKENSLLEIKSSNAPGDWVEEAALLCLERKTSALITGPVSKSTMKKNKHRSISQTPLLKTLSQTEDVFMTFFGKFFNVILLTDHCPLKEVSVDIKKLKKLLSLALLARKNLLPLSEQKKPLGLLGLNPHAGEEGLIGKEETKIKKLLSSFSAQEVIGPLVPDAAFLKKNWNSYSFYISLYHDQGLIPFKMIHSHSGFAHSLGLPFLRYSVDHGTGLGLKEKDISSKSFLESTKAALKTIRSHSRRF